MVPGYLITYFPYLFSSLSSVCPSFSPLLPLSITQNSRKSYPGAQSDSSPSFPLRFVPCVVYREKSSAFSSLVDSHQIAPTHALNSIHNISAVDSVLYTTYQEVPGPGIFFAKKLESSTRVGLENSSTSSFRAAAVAFLQRCRETWQGVEKKKMSPDI